MKFKLYFFLLVFTSYNVATAQSYDHVYDKIIGIYQQPSWITGQEYTIENFSNFSKCQTNINVGYTFNLEDGGIGTVHMYAVNGSGENLIRTIPVTDNAISSSFTIPSELLPIDQFIIKWQIGNTSSSNFIYENFTFTVTSPEASMPASPLINDVYYTVGAEATALSVDGTNIKWYTTNSGGMPITTAPVPNTSAPGVTTYWVTQSDLEGCESKRYALNVYVGDRDTNLNFDGVDDYVSINVGTNNNQVTNYTHEFWFKTSSPNGTLFNNTDNELPDSGQFNKTLYLQNGTINSYVYDGAAHTITSENTYDDDNWHHLAEIVTGTERSLYVDGDLIGTDAHFSSQSLSFINLGASLITEGIYFDGDIDELRIWNEALSIDDINGRLNCEIEGNESNLVAYYKFNQGIVEQDNSSVTTLTDATSNKFDGTLYNFDLTGVTSNWATGSPVGIPPVISIQPENQSISENESLIFNVQASGVSSYQWEVSNDEGESWFALEDNFTAPDVSGSTTNTLTISGEDIIDTDGLLFRVVLNGSSSCSIISDEVLATVTLGIPVVETTSVSIYPNPTNGILNISNTMELQTQISIFDINGRLLMSQQKNSKSYSLDISNLSNGIYIVNVKTDLGEISKKVIKN